MFIYLVALIHSPAVPPPAVASIPSAIPLKPRYEWTFLYSASAGKLGVTLVQPEVWKDEWQTLASLLMHYELDLSAFAGNNKGQPWAFRGVTRLPGPAEFLVVPDSRNGSAGEAAALLLRTSEAEELAYKLVVIEPLPSTPQPPTGFSGSGYTLSPTCEVAGLSPERPGCFPHVPSPVTLKESSFPGSLTVNRFAGGPNGLFYAREKEKEMFRFHSLDGKVDHTSLPISNPLSRLRPLFLAPILGDGGIPAVLDVRYALTDSQLSFEAFVYAHSGVSGAF